MPDPISLAAAIIAIFTAGFNISRGLYNIANGIGSAGAEVRVYADEFDSFAKLMVRICETLKQQPEPSPRIQHLLLDITGICVRIIKPFNCLQKTLQLTVDKFSPTKGKLKRIGAKFQWIFKNRKELLSYRNMLRVQHRALDTTLTLIVLEATKDKSTASIYIMSLEHSMSQLEYGFTNSAEDQQLRIGWTPEHSEHHQDSTMLLSSSTHSISQDTEEPEPKLEPSEYAASEASFTTSQPSTQSGLLVPAHSKTLIVSPLSSDSASDTLSEEDSTTVDENISRDLRMFSSQEPELQEEIRFVSRMVLRVALQTLQNHEEAKDAVQGPEGSDLGFKAGDKGAKQAVTKLAEAKPAEAKLAEAKTGKLAELRGVMEMLSLRDLMIDISYHGDDLDVSIRPVTEKLTEKLLGARVGVNREGEDEKKSEQ